MTTRTTTLTEFLLARIAELEQWAYDYRTTHRQHFDIVIEDCEAKRRIVERYHDVLKRCAFGGDDPPHEPELQGLLVAIEILALPYSDHPDYRQEWRP